MREKHKGYRVKRQKPRILAKGVKLYLPRASSDASTSAAAPSLRVDALAAVIIPENFSCGYIFVKTSN